MPHAARAQGEAGPNQCRLMQFAIFKPEAAPALPPEEAFRSGADYIVVGRPVRAADDPRAAAEAIQATISGLFT